VTLATSDREDAQRLEEDLRAANRGLAHTVARYEMLLSKLPVGIAFVDRDFRIIHINEMLAAVNGSSVAEQVGQLLASVIPDLWPQLEPVYRQVLDSGDVVLDVELETPSTSDPARPQHWRTSHYPVWFEGTVVGIGAVVVDVTERKIADQMRQKLLSIVNGSGDAIFGSTTQGIITSWNPAAERLFGYTAAEAIGRFASFIAPPELAHEQRHMRDRLNAGGPPERLETTRRHQDGHLIDVVVSASTATDETGKIVGLSVFAHDVTERLATQRALEATGRRLAEAQRIAGLGSFEFDVMTGEIIWSDEYFRILGLDRHTVPSGELSLSMVYPEDRRVVRQAWLDAVERAVPLDLDYRVLRADSKVSWVNARAVADLDENGKVIKLAGTLRDNTARVEMEAARQAAETRFEIGFEQAEIGTAILDLAGAPIRVNPALCKLLGRPAELLLGRPWAAYNHPDEVSPGPAVMARIEAGFDTYSDERRYVRPDGSGVWASTHVTLVRDEAGEPQYFLAQFLDITERKRMEQELSHQALHDSLTDLPNRALLTDRLLHGLAGSRRGGSRLGVIFLDVDHFKVVNDSLGHNCGDDLLRVAGDRIAAAIRPGDTVARFGGDEFVIVCTDVSVEVTVVIAQRVLESLSQVFVIDGQEMSVTASMGIAVSDEKSTSDSLLRDSDAAMYRAKELGRGRIEVFDEVLRAKAERRLATASALRHALDRHEFAVHYQPIVDLCTGEMVSAEALLRWTHPHRGAIGPDEFIPIAEDTGLILGIGAWVLEQACEELVVWQRTAPSMSVAVNLSVRQMIAPDIAGLIGGVLCRTGVRPECLRLELTESVFMEDVEYFARTMTELKCLGVQLAIDDFGTGYSSLSYLTRYPVDAVKVDRAFVEGLGTDPQRTALVGAIIAMADAIGLEVTAEGVETADQLASLRRLECARAQGFYLARPMPAAALGELVAESHRWQVD
jgi:diguanylate cyclase (GGDEF)-like protein/PAS domain S-box-containing protein